MSGNIQVVTNAKLWVGGYDLSARMSKLGLTYGAAAQDASAFGPGTAAYLPGLKKTHMAHEGLYEAGASPATTDDRFFAEIGLNGTLATVAPTTGAEGEAAYFQKIMAGSYKPGATVGQVLRATFDAEAADRLVRGTVLINGTKSASSTGTIFQVGAIASTQSLYAGLHIFGVTGTGGPTLAVTIQSAALVGFGSPTTRLTVATQSAVGAVYATPVAGAVTDTFWRVNYTLTGSTPGFTFAVIMGIQ